MEPNQANDHDPSQLTLHLIEAAGMKADIENLKRQSAETNVRILTVLGEMSSDLKALRTDVAGVPHQIDVCRQDMRREVERDFPTKPEAILMEQRIEKQIAEVDKTLGKQIADVDTKLTQKLTDVENKVDRQWLKISVIVATIVALGGILQWIFVMSQAFP